MKIQSWVFTGILVTQYLVLQGIEMRSGQGALMTVKAPLEAVCSVPTILSPCKTRSKIPYLCALLMYSR